MRHQLVIASGNQGKIQEIQQLLNSIEVVPQAEFAVSTVAETGLSFVENAIIKARHAAQHAHLPALADDSGLEVDALQGAPGIYSARYAGSQANDASNNQKLLGALSGVPEKQRSARYQCVIVYLRHPKDPTPKIFHGTWEGLIAAEPRGAGGFGYDPLFWLADKNCTAAELSDTEKNQISHRGQALRAFQQFINSDSAQF